MSNKAKSYTFMKVLKRYFKKIYTDSADQGINNNNKFII